MIDIDHLSIEELFVLNDRIVERIKFLEHAQAHLSMMAFNIGAQVSFETSEGRQFGRLVKRNRKTVNVDTGDGRQWRISPHLLTAVKEVNEPPAAANKRAGLPQANRKRRKQNKRR
jgi:hypothetical protein